MKIDHTVMLRDVAGISGALLVGFGCGMIYLPAGLIVFGLMLLFAAFAAAKNA